VNKDVYNTTHSFVIIRMFVSLNNSTKTKNRKKKNSLLYKLIR